MRKMFIKSLVSEAHLNPDIWLLCGDLGYSVLEEFSDTFPDRFLNVGVAEQNMVGVATGLALSGKVVFVYSIGNFATFRCLEQIRNDACYHKANVKIVAVGGGLGYGAQGYTHHAIEDIAVMRALPGIRILAPGDPIETEFATRAISKLWGPAYMRLGKAGEPNLHSEKVKLEVGKCVRLLDGNDATIISTGNMLEISLDVCKDLNNQGHSIGLCSMHTLKPTDENFLNEESRRVKHIFTVEEHSQIGGLADICSTEIAQLDPLKGRIAALTAFNIKENFLDGPPGSQNYLRQRAGLDAETLKLNITKTLNTKT